VMGHGLPECFKQDASDLQILNLTQPNSIESYKNILKYARKNSVTGSWITALRIGRIFSIIKNFFWRFRLVQVIKRLIIK